MFFSIVASYLPYALITALTPGPNNIVALYSVAQGGLKGAKRILLGIAVGFFCVMELSAIFCYQLAKYVPSLTGILKYLGAAYIVYLAIHVLLSKPAEGGEAGKSSFLRGFFLQFMNVKIILYSITVFTAYILPWDNYLPHLLMHGAAMTCIGMTGLVTWSFAGGVLQKLIGKYYKIFNIAMAIILLWCALALIID